MVKFKLKPSMSVREARLLFQRCEMKNGSFDEYFAQLEDLMQYCHFTDNVKEERLIEQIIHGISDDRLRDKLISIDDIPLKDVLEKCRSFYSSEANASTKPDSPNGLVEELAIEDSHDKLKTSNSHDSSKVAPLNPETSTDVANGINHENERPAESSCSVAAEESVISVTPGKPKKPTKPQISELIVDESLDPVTDKEFQCSDNPAAQKLDVELDDEFLQTEDEKSSSESLLPMQQSLEPSSKLKTSKTAKGDRAMAIRVKRIDDELSTHHIKVIEKLEKTNPEMKHRSSSGTGKKSKNISDCEKILRKANEILKHSDQQSTASDEELNLKLTQVKVRNKKSKGDLRNAEKIKSKKRLVSENESDESEKSSESDAVQIVSENESDESKKSPKSDVDHVASQSKDGSGEESSENESEVEDDDDEDVASDSDSDFELSSQSKANGVRRSKRIKKDTKKSKGKKRRGNERSTSKRKRGVDNLNVSDSISDDEESLKLVGKGKKKRRAVLKDEDEDEDSTIELSSTVIESTSTKTEEKDTDVKAKRAKVEDSDDEKDSPGKAGRKNIRQILSTRELEKDTKKANMEERERRKRISEKSKDGMTDFYKDEKNNKIVYTRLCFEQKEDKSDLVAMHEDLVCNLKPHQVEGVQFLWDCTVESTERAKTTKGSGAVLAHCMGLGKSLQVISFIHTMLTHEDLPFKTALIVVPANTILNWVNEFDLWVPEDVALDIYEISQYKDDKIRADILCNWQKDGGVMIIGYNMFRTFTNPTRRKAKRFLPKVKAALLDPGPDFVICDEGHLLKNDATALSKAISQISTRRRIVLTGTPLQNNLNEYHCMVDFVKQNLLGTKNEFRNRFINPITNGQQKDASALDVKVMKRRSHVLHELLAGCVQRRDYCYITKYLPPKYEYVLSIRLSERQIRLYNKYLKLFCYENVVESTDDSSSDSLIIPKEHQVVRRDGTRSLFKDFQMLARVWTHPYCLKLIPPKDLVSDGSDEGSFVCDDDSEEEEFTKKGKRSKGNNNREQQTRGGGSEKRKKKDEDEDEDSDFAESPEDDDEETASSKEVIKKYKTQTGRGAGDRAVRELSPPPEETFWYSDILQEEDQYNLALSGKLVLLCEVLKRSELVGDKVLLFSQSLMALTLIEDTLAMLSEARKNNWKVGETDSEGFLRSVDGTEAGQGLWVANKDYLRLDGASPVPFRKKMCDQFNSKSNKRCRLFLISTKAGSLGINLVSANRVIIFDASWNPSHDIQSMFRCYRFGQTKTVYIYRFIAQGTMEEKIYNRQVTKESLSLRVVDESQIDRHFSRDELDDLYQFEPNVYKEDDDSTPVCAVPKDPLLADLLISRKDILYKYHEHDSLLQHQADQNLSEEDKKAAWEEYEKERQGGPNLAQVRQQQLREEMMNANMLALQQQYQRSQTYSLQQQILDSKYLEKACSDMINWGAICGVPGASQQRASLMIQQFMLAIRNITPAIGHRPLGDKIYDLFPNYYLNSLGVTNPKFASSAGNMQNNAMSTQRAPTGQPATSDTILNQGFGVAGMNAPLPRPILPSTAKKPETVTLSSSINDGQSSKSDSNNTESSVEATANIASTSSVES